MLELLEKYQALRDDLMEELSHKSIEDEEDAILLESYKLTCITLSRYTRDAAIARIAFLKSNVRSKKSRDMYLQVLRELERW